MAVIKNIVILSPASVVSSSKHHSVLQLKDSVGTSVVVGRSFSFKSSSLRLESAVIAVVE